MTDFTNSIDLAAERLGGRALFANDDFFAPKENLLKADRPVFIEDKYTDRGKWMDGWETRRRREPGHDWCIVKLGLPGIIRSVVVDTSYFKGNYPESCSIEALALPSGTTDPPLNYFTSEDAEWIEILPNSPLQGDCVNRFVVDSPFFFTHLRLNIYPDGGVARLRVHGEGVPDRNLDWRAGKVVDLAAAEHGGCLTDSSDMFFGSGNNLILPGPARNMGDGWETKRRRGPGYDWVIIRLGAGGKITRAVVDTSYFKGNYPESCSLETCVASEKQCMERRELSGWRELLPRVKLHADSVHTFEKELTGSGPATHVRFNIYPDGGVARLRLFGEVSEEGLQNARLRRLNALVPAQAEAALVACCGSTVWAGRMVKARPFTNADEMVQRAGQIWRDLGEADWREAFSRHPKIGASLSGATDPPSRWSEQEQAAARTASSDLLRALESANERYEARFGYIFIVCATGKSAEEMLALLEHRLQNEPEEELIVAADEQGKITQLRLRKLLGCS